jgi:transposase
MNSIRFVGLDVHRDSVRACIRSADDKIVHEETLGCTRQALQSFGAERLQASDVLALETTFHSWAISDVLRPFVSKVVVSNPQATKAIAHSKVKTDKVDARVISELLRIDYLPEVWTPDPATRELRTLCARRASLVSDSVRLKNRIHGVLARNLVPKPKAEIFDDKGLRQLAALDLPENSRLQLASDVRLLTLTQAELQEHDRILIRYAWEDPRVKLLITMPGVDVTVALAILAALGEVDRFGDGDHLAAYLGLVPSTRQSGDHCYHGPITKRGNGKARWLLIQAAQHLGAHPGPLGVFFRRLATRKNRNVAVVATARKLAVIAWHMLTKKEPYRYAQPAPTQGKLARLRVRATGAKKKTGPAKGSPKSENFGTGRRTRTVPALPELYRDEGLPNSPPTENLKKAELRTLEQMRVLEYVRSLQNSDTQERKRSSKAPKAKARKAEPSEQPVPISPEETSNQEVLA